MIHELKRRGVEFFRITWKEQIEKKSKICEGNHLYGFWVLKVKWQKYDGSTVQL